MGHGGSKVFRHVSKKYILNAFPELIVSYFVLQESTIIVRKNKVFLHVKQELEQRARNRARMQDREDYVSFSNTGHVLYIFLFEICT